MYEERFYRNWMRSEDLVGFRVTVKETDLFIEAERDLSAEASRSVHQFRDEIEKHISLDPKFQTTLEPYEVDSKAPTIIRDMARASSLVGVGPFACVAGAIAEYVGKELLSQTGQIIIENGGDIFIKSSRNRTVGIYAGSSSFNRKLALKIKGEETPLGICTSSGTVGHSLSFGKADAVAVLSASTLLADAAATRIGNLIKSKADIPEGIEFAEKVEGLRGIVIIKDDKMGAWGKVELCQIE